MEKIDNMQQNKIADEELDQITGGRNLMDVFTAEFRGKAGKATTLHMDPGDENNDFAVTTLEMRANPNEKKKNERIVKL